MKTLTTHINEALKIGKNLSSFSTYSCQPKTREELEKIIKERISKDGPNCDLNDIDTSLITDMSRMFFRSPFNGDISKWDVSNVKNMSRMFLQSNFNSDISRWDVSNVEDMYSLFYQSKFNQDISNWNVNNVTDMSYTFALSSFNRDISKWNINKDCDTFNIFIGAPIEEQFKPKALQQ